MFTPGFLQPSTFSTCESECDDDMLGACSRLVGSCGTKMMSPTNMRLALSRQFTARSSGTLVPVALAIENNVFPGATTYPTQPDNPLHVDGVSEIIVNGDNVAVEVGKIPDVSSGMGVRLGLGAEVDVYVGVGVIVIVAVLVEVAV